MPVPKKLACLRGSAAICAKESLRNEHVAMPLVQWGTWDVYSQGRAASQKQLRDGGIHKSQPGEALVGPNDMKNTPPEI